jgi:hypothetical protein
MVTRSQLALVVQIDKRTAKKIVKVDHTPKLLPKLVI